MKNLLALILFLSCFLNNAQISPTFNPIPASYGVGTTNPVYALDIEYNTIDVGQQAFHLFLPDTVESYPLIIHIHEGGFRGGSRDQILTDPSLQAVMKYYLENGFAFATIGYRILPPETATYVDSVGVIKCLSDSKRSLQFMRYHADDLFIDKHRVGLRGGSAGAGTCMWLATRDDMAEPSSSDPVLRESTRVCGVYYIGGQATYDLYKWESVIFNDWDGMGSNYTVDSMVNLLGFERYSDFYGGIDSNYHILHDPELIQYRQDVDMLYHLSSDDPAIYINSGNTAIHPSDDLLHHPLHAKYLYEAAESIISAEVVANITAFGINTTGSEAGEEFLARLVGDCNLGLSTEEKTVNNIQFNVYPNPTTDNVTVNGNSNTRISRVIVYSNTGSVINEISDLNDYSLTLDFYDYDKGIYLIQVIDENGNSSVQRVVKM